MAPAYFSSLTKTVINHRFRLESSFQEILYMIDVWIKKESGWNVESIGSQYINISTYRPLSGSSYMDLPVELRSPRKGLINIKNLAPAYFSSLTKTVINHRFRLESSFQEILYRIDVWIKKESGWNVESIDSQYINISTYRPLSGSSYMDLPVELRSPRKGLINIKNLAPAYFSSLTKTVINHRFRLESSFQEILYRIDVWIKKESGWNVESIGSQYINISTYRPLSGSSYMDLPVELRSPRKGLINIKNLAPAYFSSLTKTVINHRFRLESSFQEILYRIDVWIKKESGWNVESIDSQYINISTYRPLSGSSYMDLPVELRSPRKGLINIKNLAPAYFSSLTKTVINHRFRLESSFQEILYRIDVWIKKESGWNVESIDSQYINISTYRPLSGSSYMDLPVELRSPRKGLINIKNKAKKCFLRCHGRHINP